MAGRTYTVQEAAAELGVGQKRLFRWLREQRVIDASAIPPTYPYTADAPCQTGIADFKEGAAQAFEEAWYWSSTQHAATPGFAWCQDFGNGYQLNERKVVKLRARAVRRLPI